MNNPFVQQVTDKIKSKRDKALIAAELESHILDKADFYREIGYDEQTALKKATEEMGDPDDTALPLRALTGGAGSDWFYLISIIYLAATVIVPIFFHKFDYAGGYYRAVYHLNIIDFISLAIVFSYVLILCLAYKTKSKGITLLSAITLLLSCFNGLSIFRPTVYAVVKIITSGFGGYVDNIFAYTYFTESLRAPLIIGSYIIFAVLIIWAAIQWTVIFMRERLRRTKKLNGIIRIIRRTAVILLCADLTIMTAGTVFAIAGLPEKQEQTKAEKQKVLDYVLKNDSYWFLPTSDFEELKNKPGELKPYYYDTVGDNSIGFYYLSNSNNCLIYSKEMISYSRTNYDSYFSVLSPDDILTREQTEVIEKYSETLKKNTGFRSDNYGLNDLKEKGIFQKAIVFTRQWALSYDICYIDFFGTTENGQIRPLRVVLCKYGEDWIAINVYFGNRESGNKDYIY